MKKEQSLYIIEQELTKNKNTRIENNYTCVFFYNLH